MAITEDVLNRICTFGKLLGAPTLIAIAAAESNSKPLGATKKRYFPAPKAKSAFAASEITIFPIGEKVEEHSLTFGEEVTVAAIPFSKKKRIKKLRVQSFIIVFEMLLLTC